MAPSWYQRGDDVVQYDKHVEDPGLETLKRAKSPLYDRPQLPYPAFGLMFGIILGRYVDRNGKVSFWGESRGSHSKGTHENDSIAIRC